VDSVKKTLTRVGVAIAALALSSVGIPAAAHAEGDVAPITCQLVVDADSPQCEGEILLSPQSETEPTPCVATFDDDGNQQQFCENDDTQKPENGDCASVDDQFDVSATVCVDPIPASDGSCETTVQTTDDGSEYKLLTCRDGSGAIVAYIAYGADGCVTTVDGNGDSGVACATTFEEPQGPPCVDVDNGDDTFTKVCAVNDDPSPDVPYSDSGDCTSVNDDNGDAGNLCNDLVAYTAGPVRPADCAVCRGAVNSTKVTTKKPAKHTSKVTTKKPAKHTSKVTTKKPAKHTSKVTTKKPAKHTSKVTAKELVKKPVKKVSKKPTKKSSKHAKK
jgi:hypothetical protein